MQSLLGSVPGQALLTYMPLQQNKFINITRHHEETWMTAIPPEYFPPEDYVNPANPHFVNLVSY